MLLDLIRALTICDDEKFLILNPETKEGWECTAGQIENNFSLMSLIQFCFHHERILEDMDIEYDYNKDVDLFAHNVFDLTNKEPSADRDIKLIGFYNYNAYQTDGKCNAFLDNRNTPDPRAWIYGEMSVGSIPMLDGYRIVLITKDPVISHTWDIHFMLPVHPVVKPEFKIVRKLEKSEVENWFGKIKTEIIS